MLWKMQNGAWRIHDGSEFQEGDGMSRMQIL